MAAWKPGCRGSSWTLSPTVCSSARIPRVASAPGNSVISRVFQRGANLPVYTMRTGSRAASCSGTAKSGTGTLGGYSTHLPHAAGTQASVKQRNSSVWHSR